VGCSQQLFVDFQRLAPPFRLPPQQQRKFVLIDCKVVIAVVLRGQRAAVHRDRFVAPARLKKLGSVLLVFVSVRTERVVKPPRARLDRAKQVGQLRPNIELVAAAYGTCIRDSDGRGTRVRMAAYAPKWHVGPHARLVIYIRPSSGSRKAHRVARAPRRSIRCRICTSSRLRIRPRPPALPGLRRTA